jgi:hypothetical protein
LSEHLASRLLVAFLLLAPGGCATVSWLLHPPARLPACPGPIPSADTLPRGDLSWRDRVRYRGGEVDVGFVLVAEKRASRLVLVALNSFGAHVFSVIQQQREITVESRLGRALQVPPESVLRDWHAARAAALEAPGRLELARPECGYTATFVAEYAR